MVAPLGDHPAVRVPAPGGGQDPHHRAEKHGEDDERREPDALDHRAGHDGRGGTGEQGERPPEHARRVVREIRPHRRAPWHRGRAGLEVRDETRRHRQVDPPPEHPERRNHEGEGENVLGAGRKRVLHSRGAHFVHHESRVNQDHDGGAPVVVDLQVDRRGHVDCGLQLFGTHSPPSLARSHFGRIVVYPHPRGRMRPIRLSRLLRNRGIRAAHCLVRRCARRHFLLPAADHPGRNTVPTAGNPLPSGRESTEISGDFTVASGRFRGTSRRRGITGCAGSAAPAPIGPRTQAPDSASVTDEPDPAGRGRDPAGVRSPRSPATSANGWPRSSAAGSSTPTAGSLEMAETCGGEGGIRTLGTLLTYTHFPGVLLKPLGHLSGRRKA